MSGATFPRCRIWYSHGRWQLPSHTSMPSAARSCQQRLLAALSDGHGYIYVSTAFEQAAGDSGDLCSGNVVARLECSIRIACDPTASRRIGDGLCRPMRSRNIREGRSSVRQLLKPAADRANSARVIGALAGTFRCCSRGRSRTAPCSRYSWPPSARGHIGEGGLDVRICLPPSGSVRQAGRTWWSPLRGFIIFGPGQIRRPDSPLGTRNGQSC